MAKTVSKAKGMELFAHTRLVTGNGKTPAAAIADAKATVEASDLRGFVKTGTMGPDERWLKGGYTCHIIFAEKKWWKSHVSQDLL